MFQTPTLGEDSNAMAARMSAGGQFLQVAPELAQLLGMAEQELTGRRYHDITHPDDVARNIAQVERLLSAGQGSYNLLKRYMHSSGAPIWIESQVMLEAAPDQAEQVFDLLIRQAPVSPDALEDVHNKAFRDALTGLANRHALEEQFLAAEARTRRTGKPFVFAMVDLDGFKQVNDTRGHKAGDALLAAVSRRLNAGIGPLDFAARMGGDEFGVLLTDILNETDLRNRIARIRQELMPAYTLPGGVVQMTASLGWAIYPQEGRSTAALIEQADNSMYRAKRALNSRAARRPPIQRLRTALG